MENNDLAIIIPHLGQEALYRVLSSLTLQSDSRFAVYGFYLRGEDAIRSLFEDYAEQLDLILCEAEAFPAAEEPFSAQLAFYLGRLGQERFVTFSDGETLYGRDCVAAFHGRSCREEVGSIFRWGSGNCSFRRFIKRVLLGHEAIAGPDVIFRRTALERHVGDNDYFSRYQILADLACPDGIIGLNARVELSKPAAGMKNTDQCSVLEWADERFEGTWPLSRRSVLWRMAGRFTDMVPDVPKEEIRRRFTALRIAQESGLASLVYTLNSWGL